MHYLDISNRKLVGDIVDLLLVGIILLLALIAIRISDKYGIPSLLLFMLLGIGFSLLGVEFEDYEVSDKFASLALMVIMFYGGFGTNWKMAKPVARESIILSSLGVVATAFLTGLFCYYVLDFSFVEGMLLGSVVGSTDYASVSSILRSKNLNLKYNTAPLLELESGSNDPTAYTMTMIFLSIIIGTEISVPLMVLKQLAFGLGIGFLMALCIMRLMERIHLAQDGLLSVFISAVALITYSLTNVIGGNGYLAVYILGIYLGNRPFVGKRDVVFFFDGFTELMQIALFFLLGLLSNPIELIKVLPMAFFIMVFMTIIARPLAVFGLMAPFKLERSQLLMISLAGLRGAAAIAFAIMVVNENPILSHDLFHIVFGICVLSSLVQGSLMPIVSRKLNMLDPNDTVLKTFNYYQDKSDIGFLETRIYEDSNLVGQKVKDLNMAFDFIVAKLTRNGKMVVPKGETILEANDHVVLAGEYYYDPTGQDLIQFTISEYHPWVNTKIKDLDLANNCLILIVQRENGDIIVPGGDIEIIPGDIILMIESEEEIFFDVEEGSEKLEKTEKQG